MFGSEALDIVLGLVLIFLLISIMLSALVEMIEASLKTRAADLEKAIGELFREPNTIISAEALKRFYQHPLISGLYGGDYKTAEASLFFKRETATNLPSYIPRELFSAAALELTKAMQGESPVVKVVQSLSSVSLAEQKAQVEGWYDGAMDRIAGKYKRRTQKLLFWLGLFVAITLNINPFAISEYLAQNPKAREQITQVAQRVQQVNEERVLKKERGERNQDQKQQKDQGESDQRICSDTAINWDSAGRCQQAIAEVGMPLGWSKLAVAKTFPNFGLHEPYYGFGFGLTWDIVVAILGWAITGLAATLGAPFWFDVLNKLMVIRSTVKPREKSPDEASEDRSAKSAQKLGAVPGTGNASVPAGAGQTDDDGAVG